MIRLFISGVLFFAGLFHLILPELFNPAIPFAWKSEINIFVGIMEVILALLLWSPRFKDFAARASALWFLLLIPIHIYVSFYQIPMFGISHPALLWVRTLLQPLLYVLALSIQDKNWIISQRWSDVVFLHFEVDAQKLQCLTPFPLDLYQGKAIVSIVPFVMSHIRFPFLPSVPGLSKLYELNLRTYVKVDNRAGVYFFTLDSNHLPGVFIARWFFSLPYRWVKLTFIKEKDYHFSSTQFDLVGEVSALAKRDLEFNTWATERYALFTKKGNKTLCGVVEHEPWDLREFKVIKIRDDFSNLIGDELKAKYFLSTTYAHRLDVRFRPFKTL